MRFALNWDNGYIVECEVYEHGMYRYRPLRKFHDQGDAMVFRDFDCPKLSENGIKALLKRYDPNKQYKRLRDGKIFRDYNNWVQEAYDEHASMM